MIWHAAAPRHTCRPSATRDERLDPEMSIIAVSLFRRNPRKAQPAASAHRATAGLCLAATVTLLSGCSGGASAPPVVVVTVTTTPTVTARVASTTPTAATTPGGTAKSDVVGRKFDLGTIVRVQNNGGVPVIILDRWTAYGVPDSTLAASGQG